MSFHMEPQWDGGTKVCSTGPGHITKMAAIPYIVKTLKTSSSPEPKADDLKTWHAASSAQVLPSLFN